MRVVLARSAADYIRKEAAYLCGHSRSAGEAFIVRVQTVRRDLTAFAEAGEILPGPNVRRLIRVGYRFDYRIGSGVVEIVAVSSSVNTPLDMPSDDPDFDYEA